MIDIESGTASARSVIMLASERELQSQLHLLNKNSLPN